jgi:Tfp pilus assembly protein PilF
MRKFVTLFFVLVLLAGGVLAYIYWPSVKRRVNEISMTEEHEKKDLQKTKELLSNSKPEEAFTVIQQYSDRINMQTETGKEWLDLLIRASEATLNTQQLTILYDYYPKAFEGHEKASLLVANLYISTGRGKDYQTIRDSWKGRETKPEAWFVLDADRLLLEGKRKEAIDLLSSQTFSGKNDTARLIRLALLHIFEQPKEAWDYLTLAYSKDPENPEIRSYRAKLLETVGKNSLALSEYLAAVHIDPKNLYLKDQLAEFYLRNKQYPQALKIWVENLAPPSLDFFWIKALFWSKVIGPVEFDWESAQPPPGRQEPFIRYLLDLEPGEFWNSKAFDKLENSQQYLKNQQVTFWLRLLQALKDKKEKEAQDLLQYNPFSSVSWNPPLESALKKVVQYRKTEKFNPEAQNPFETSFKTSAGQNPEPPAKDPFFYSQLNFYAYNEGSDKPEHVLPEQLKELITGEDAYSVVLLSAGWPEAALQLNSLQVIPSSYPDWVANDLTQAIRLNRGTKAALDFAMQQPQTPTLSMLIGELFIAQGNQDEALDYLLKLVKEDSDIGFRSAWLASLIYIERGQYAEAKTIIRAQPRLAKDILGQETLARIALLEGDSAQADRLYSALEKSSAEAKSYLARKAFAEKNWNRARELTEALLKQFPTNALLHDNLKKIIEEQNRSQTTR